MTSTSCLLHRLVLNILNPHTICGTVSPLLPLPSHCYLLFCFLGCPSHRDSISDASINLQQTNLNCCPPPPFDDYGFFRPRQTVQLALSFPSYSNILRHHPSHTTQKFLPTSTVALAVAFFAQLRTKVDRYTETKRPSIVSDVIFFFLVWTWARRHTSSSILLLPRAARTRSRLRLLQ